MWNTLLAAALIVVSVTLILRRADVRLVLASSAFPLFALAGKLNAFFGVAAKEMGNAATVVPIGSALGFAYVLKQTGCDQHLVHLLLRPLRRARALLIPGGIAAGFLVNTAVVSQTGSAAVLGPVLVPLLRAGGVSPVTAGAVLLIGCSMGGELFNPGAVEIVTLSGLTRIEPPRLVERVAPLNLLAGGTALASFWIFAIRRGRREAKAADRAERDAEARVEAFRVNPIKAAVPAIPLVLLFAAPDFLRLPEEYKTLHGPATILAAMLVGVVAAGLTSPRGSSKLAAAFFEGAGYAYTHVISLIVTATLFAEGLKVNGLIDRLVGLLTRAPSLATATSLAAPWALATLTGTGIAPAVAVMKVLVPIAPSLGDDPVQLGAQIALAAHFGRTMSPAAAVVMMSATLSGADGLALVRRVIPPLLVGGAVLLAAVSLGFG